MGRRNMEDRRGEMEGKQSEEEKIKKRKREKNEKGGEEQ